MLACDDSGKYKDPTMRHNLSIVANHCVAVVSSRSTPACLPASSSASSSRGHSRVTVCAACGGAADLLPCST